ncbi:MAG: hypothetical protein GF364_16075 [Candidatus Lokiarchaeota archaeon]|nr:hypothetical protein [Candidatus Lokiarchaeota archaeon]
MRETLKILGQLKKNEAKQSIFYDRIKENKSYLNSFFRVKKDLIQTGIIGYRLDNDQKKIIFLTEKGKELTRLITKIENTLNHKK